MSNIQRVYSGAPWEQKVGYCRALKLQNHIFVTGTAPVDEGGSVYAQGDGYRQALKCLEIIEESLKQLGTDRRSIVRTRMFVTDISLWQEFGRAHAEFFSDNPPTTSMLQISQLIDPEMLIEIEADGLLTEET